MRPAPVEGLRADGEVGENLARVLGVRTAELGAQLAPALGSGEAEALHDLRIAVRRIRDLLELAGAALGDEREAGALARDLDGLHHRLGVVHDADVALPRLRAHADDLRAADAEALRDRARAREGGGPAADDGEVPPRLAVGLPRAEEHRGVATLEAHLLARRAEALRAAGDAWGSERRAAVLRRLAVLAGAPAARPPHGHEGAAPAG